MGPLEAPDRRCLLRVNWEMETPALTVILEYPLSTATALATLVLFTAVAVSTSVVPAAAHLAAPDRVGGVLTGAKAWLGRYERPIMLVLFLAIGAAFTASAARRSFVSDRSWHVREACREGFSPGERRRRRGHA